MEVILLEKQRMGNLGDKVNVKPGYARNYLFPQGKAASATAANIAKFEAQRAELETKQQAVLGEAQKLAEQISGKDFVIPAAASEEGKLFGSVGTRDIAAALSATGNKIEKKSVLLPQGALREVGEFAIQIQLHSDVVATVSIHIKRAD